MKTKLRFVFALVGVAAIVAMTILLILQVVSFGEFWVDYVFGIAVLFIVIPLNFRASSKD